MRYFVISDIHGDSACLKKALDIYKNDKFDNILLLGDILYHGPRNDLPSGYNPKEWIKLLNEVSDENIAIKGNCDAYVDQMVLNFYIHNEYEFMLDGKRIIMTHGHIINPTQHLNLSGAIVLYGHTHIHSSDEVMGSLYLNPGSLSIPQGGQDCSYAILDSESFEVISLDGKTLMKVSI